MYNIRVNGSQQGWMPTESQWSKYLEKLLPAHKVHALASTNERNFDKMYVLAKAFHDTTGWLYFLYRIDISSASKDNDNSIKPLHPILHILNNYESAAYYAYVVVDSKLFLMGGLEPAVDDSRWSASWCSYDMSKAMDPDTTTLVEEEDLENGPSMNGRKYAPVSAVVGDYKICLFATVLYMKCVAETGNEHFEPPNFEVFHTGGWCWTQLPELVDDYSKLEKNVICINSYCIELSCLIICTNIGIYGINVDAEKPDWVKMRGSEVIERGPFSRGRWAVVGRNMCCPFEVARWGEVKSYPLGFGNKGPLNPGTGILCSERVTDGVILCGVQCTIARTTGVPSLFVNIVKFDSESLENTIGDDWKTIQSDKSSIF